MPEEGVSQFLKNIGKGASTSRERLSAYTEQPDPDPLIGPLPPPGILTNHYALRCRQVLCILRN